MKFRYVSKYKILKPHYERKCYTLVQEVESLQYNRESVWKNHIAEENVWWLKKKHNKIQIQRYVDQAGVPFLLYETEEKEKS